jgi:CMP-N-acetylneuraminic acid synthetase
MVDRVMPLNPSRSPLREDGSLQPAFQIFAQSLANRALIIGTGSPESVIEANKGALYMDDAGTAGAILYIKRDADIAGDKTQGWILV